MLATVVRLLASSRLPEDIAFPNWAFTNWAFPNCSASVHGGPLDNLRFSVTSLLDRLPHCMHSGQPVHSALRQVSFRIGKNHECVAFFLADPFIPMPHVGI